MEHAITSVLLVNATLFRIEFRFAIVQDSHTRSIADRLREGGCLRIETFADSLDLSGAKMHVHPLFLLPSRVTPLERLFAFVYYRIQHKQNRHMLDQNCGDAS